jgi:hypothetical protein
MVFEGKTVFTVTARELYGAGIGSGDADSGGLSSVHTILIRDGVINATAAEHGAGIGSARADTGSTSSLDNIIIQGGVINAVGINEGAGIGSGYAHDESTTSHVGEILIEGGVLNVQGGTHGAGIGAGWANQYGDSSVQGITITGGSGVVVGGESAAGIGAGLTESTSRPVGSIVLSGGDYTVDGSVGVGASQTSQCGSIRFEGPSTNVSLACPSPNYCISGDQIVFGAVPVRIRTGRSLAWTTPSLTLSTGRDVWVEFEVTPATTYSLSTALFRFGEVRLGVSDAITLQVTSGASDASPVVRETTFDSHGLKGLMFSVPQAGDYSLMADGQLLCSPSSSVFTAGTSVTDIAYLAFCTTPTPLATPTAASTPLATPLATASDCFTVFRPIHMYRNVRIIFLMYTIHLTLW